MIPYFAFKTIKLGPINFQIWGILLALAIITTFLLILRQTKSKKINQEFVLDIFLWVLAGVFIGMRFFYIIQFPFYYLEDPKQIFNLVAGGYASWGGILGGLGATFFYLKTHRLDKKTLKHLPDIVAEYLPIGLIIGRIGCFLVKDHVGASTSLPWGIIWPDGIIRHPIALYLIFGNLVIFFLLRKIKSILQPGELFYYFLGFYSLLRFLFDFTRTNLSTKADPQILSLGVSQWIYLGIFFINAFFLFLKRKKQS